MSIDPQSSAGLPSLIARVAGGLFALFVAPLIVTVGSGYVQKKIETQIDAIPAKVAAGKGESAKKSRPSPTPSPRPRPSPIPIPAVGEKKAAAPKLARRDSEKKLPSPTVHLFNGNDLNPFTSYLGIPNNGTQAYGKNNDPEKVFAVEYRDLHVSGKVTGILESEQEYENFQLTVEYRFGQKTWPPRESSPKISGVLLHAKAPPEDNPTQWRLGYRVTIAEDSAGSIVMPPADQSLNLTVEAEKAVGPKGKVVRNRYRYQPGATPLTLAKGTIDRLGDDVPGLVES